MKKTIIILWVLFPVAILLHLALSFLHVYSLLLGNVLTSLIFLLPITAMTLQTIMNKDRNSSKTAYIIKMSFCACMLLMVIYLFIVTLIAFS